MGEAQSRPTDKGRRLIPGRVPQKQGDPQPGEKGGRRGFCWSKFFQRGAPGKVKGGKGFETIATSDRKKKWTE